MTGRLVTTFEHRMLSEVLHAVKKYEKENNGR